MKLLTIREALNSAVPYVRLDRDAWSFLVGGERYTMSMYRQVQGGVSGRVISFYRVGQGLNDYSVAGTGGARAVMSTVLSILLTYGNDVPLLIFSAHEPSRRRLYGSMADRIRNDYRRCRAHKFADFVLVSRSLVPDPVEAEELAARYQNAEPKEYVAPPSREGESKPNAA